MMRRILLVAVLLAYAKPFIDQAQALNCDLSQDLSTSASDSWQLEADKDGVQIHSRKVAKYKEFRGSITISTSLKKILNILEDHKKCHEIFDNCIEERIIENISKNQSIRYTHMKSSVLTKNRDVIVMRTQIDCPEKKLSIIKFESLPKYTYENAAKETERIRETRGMWLLIKLPEQNTKIVYTLYSDPNVSWPASLGVNLGIRRAMKKTLKNLKNMVHK